MLKQLRNLFLFVLERGFFEIKQTPVSQHRLSDSHNSPSHYYKAMAADQQRLDEAIEFLNGGMSAV